MSCRFCGFFNPEYHDRELGDLCETCLGLVEYGVDREQSRIIKLFEDFITKQSSYIDDETPADIAEGYLVEIESAEYWIDRIKGQNK